MRKEIKQAEKCVKVMNKYNSVEDFVQMISFIMRGGVQFLSNDEEMINFENFDREIFEYIIEKIDKKFKKNLKMFYLMGMYSCWRASKEYISLGVFSSENILSSIENIKKMSAKERIKMVVSDDINSFSLEKIILNISDEHIRFSQSYGKIINRTESIFSDGNIKNIMDECMRVPLMVFYIAENDN